ncbi:techylectin-5A-like [Mercenaria mercenaria]|uniref:techylectin-5A-like n=1 Tax=Mercenaria mercenaria TaxID=6596 RepID=UPI00234EEBFB|nr:techylectin-5A-like [Mercenaria mercenaria]
MDTGNGGWTIIQRRTSYSDFHKTWTEYKNGFGAVDGNYWLGNDNIATLTGLGNYTIRFDLYDQSNVHTYAVYSTFSITDESQKYRLTVSGYSGDAGDDFSSHSGMMFTTEDEDNDIAENTNCAKYYNGGWWFSNCHNANLNGEYGSTESGHGIMWYSVTGLTQSLSVTEMKIKRT